MKRLFSVLLILSLGILLVSGCQQATTHEPTVPADQLASSLGVVAKDSLRIDSDLINTTFPSLSVMDVNATAVSTPEYTDGWWTFGDSYTDSGGFTYTRSFQVKVWDAFDAEITTLAGLQAIDDTTDISKLWIYATWNVTYSGATYTIKFGASTSDPLKFEGYNTADQSISGPISYTSTYQEQSFEISYTYGDLQMTGSGYPTGSITFNVYENNNLVVSGTITFDGTNIATIAFTTGLSGTYTVNLDTGAVTPASS
jgi:hypothetical protein